MKLTIVYDNNVLKKEMGLESDWGFSCLIQTQNKNILFDTGTKGRILLNNMKKLDIDPKNIDIIVLSHEHHDHIGGLKSLIPYLSNIELYKIGKNSNNGKIKSIIPEKPEKISDNVWTTGRLKGTIGEQSLVLHGIKGWYVLTGCSHPGVGKIIQKAKEIGKVVGIIGGFHGFKNLEILEDLDFICPCHCTKIKEEFIDKYPEKAFKCGVGKVIEI